MTLKKKLFLLAISILAFGLVGCAPTTTKPSDVKIPNETHSASSNELSDTSSAVSDDLSEVNPQEIYSNSLIAMSFLKKYDIPELQGMFYFDVKAENKSNQKITIYLQDAYVNDTMFTVGSGIPLDLLPGKSAAHSFFGKYEGTGVTTADKIKKIGFKICIMDENSKNIETTKDVEINF